MSVYYYSVVYSIDTIERNNKGVIPLVIELCPLLNGVAFLSYYIQLDLNGKVYLQKYQPFLWSPC